MAERWSEELVETVAAAVRNADPQGWLTGPGGILAPYYTGAAETILAALTDAGLLVEPGGETRNVFEVRTAGVRWPGYVTEAAAWRKFAEVKEWPEAADVRIYRQTITDWPDGSVHYGRLIPLEPFAQPTDTKEPSEL